MKVVDTVGLRQQLVQARLLGAAGWTVPLADMAAMADELDAARWATKEAGDLLAEARPLIEELCRTDLVLAEHKRLRVQAGTLLPKMAQLLGEKPDTIVVGKTPLIVR